MAIPWHSSEIPLSSLNLTESRFVSEDNLEIHSHRIENLNNQNNKSISDLNENRKMWSLNSVRNVIVKSNNLFKSTDPDIDKITRLDQVDEEEDGYHTYHTGIINKAFFPMRLTLMALGRWPFYMRLKTVPAKKPQNKRNHPHFSMRVKSYESSLKSPWWLYFALTSGFTFFVLVMSTVGFCDFFLEWKILPCCQWSTLHKNIFRDNLVIFLLVWGCLVHSTMSSFSFLLNRKKVARILNYWNVAADELLLMDVRRHRRFLITVNVGYLVFLVLIYFAYSAWRIPIVRDGAELFGTISIRPLLTEEQLERTDTWKIRVFGIATIIYSVYASRSFLFLFCFKCRLLRSMFKAWNVKLVRFLRKSEYPEQDDKSTHDLIEKMESQRLLKDMTILLKLVKQTDKMFATTLQAYYAVQLLNMCFELYMLAKSGSQEFAKSEQTSKVVYIITAVLTLCQNVYFFFTVSLDGAYVGEEAAKGLEALRRHAISPSSSLYKKYLIYNLGFIYNQKITVTGGKYFTIDRPFIITVLGAVLTYFVIILQVGPSFQQRYHVSDAASDSA